MPLKQNGVKSFMKKHQVDVMGVLETKLNLVKLNRIYRNKFQGWEQLNNFPLHPAGRILVFWNPISVDIQVLDASPQAIHCRVTCKVTSNIFCLSFIYGFNSMISRRQLWSSISNFAINCSGPWILMGDFNCVMKESEKVNGRAVSSYDIKDFVDCCIISGLLDMPSAGCFYTWTNNSICSKLDRVLINNRWHLDGYSDHAIFLPPGCLSDHSPCVVSLFHQVRQSVRSFKFFNMWTKHEQFTSTVRACWELDVGGSSQFILCKKLKSLKRPLRLLNAKFFGHISSRADRANKELEEAQMILQNQPFNTEIQNSVANLRKKASFLSEAERLFFWQKAKCKYVLLSDRSSKFFHDVVRRNARRNMIPMVLKADGEATTSCEQVAEEFISFYKSLLGSSSPCEPINLDVLRSGNLLSQQQADGLIGAVSDLEIKEALFAIGEDKAPGPDGFSSCFFKKAWHVVGALFCQAIREFFVSGCLLKQINHAVIALIPKSSHASSVEDYRPISCCNVIYKVISKILAARLAPVLNSIVDHAQSAFIEGRNLSDNIHLVQELLRKYSRKRISPRCLIKVDLRKAYDSMNWVFIRQVLEGLGFPLQFISWIMECVTSTSFSISINGSMCGFFKGAKGLRQGDPISPYLFVLGMEYLSRSLNCATAFSEFNFHPKCSKLKISHLVFADDLMLMARGDPISVQILMECLWEFNSVSGLRANVLKSNIFTAGVQGPDLADILSISGFQHGSMPFRYLGIPLAAEKLRVSFYAPLIEKISEQISGWTASSLSYAGRVELIRAVLQGTECFWLSILHVPAAVIDVIYRLCRLFLWNSKHALVSWKEVCLPKREGGLGLKDLKCWNSSLLSKVLWNIHSKKDSLWIKWIHNEYLISSSIWERTAKKDDSPLFKKLLGIRDAICMAGGSFEGAVRILSDWTDAKGLISSSAYDFFRFKGQRVRWAPVVWNASLVPKHAFFLWLCARRKVLTRDKLYFLDIDRNCPFCNAVEESMDHLFFQCHLSSRIWSQIRNWLGVSRLLSSIHSGLKWISREARGKSWRSAVKRIGLAATVYYIWSARNRMVFENLKPSSESIIHRIKTFVYRTIFSMYPYVIIQNESLV